MGQQDLGPCARSKLFWHISLKERVGRCGRNGLEAWRGFFRRFGPSIGVGHRNLLRAIVAPQRVKMEDLGSALQAWGGMVARHNKKNAKIGEVELADVIKGMVMWIFLLERRKFCKELIVKQVE